jgi:hypothetical protein
MHYDDTQVDVSRFLMVSVLWAIAGVRIVGGCLATSLVIYLFVSVLNYLARLMVIRVSACVCVCMHVCVRVCAVRLLGSVCLQVSVNVWDREGVHVMVSATVPSPPNPNAIIQAAAYKAHSHRRLPIHHQRHGLR